MDQAAIAQQTFELENNVVTLDPSTDAIFHYNDAEQRAALNDAPWRRDPHFFQRVRISSVALIKMVMHARSGGDFEIMGLMQGKVDVATRTFYVMDAFALPVQGTETRVNAANEANEFMVQYLESGRQVGRLENAIGWYHSHPGYGCWLSGIDVNTQMNNQAYTDPFLAIVIDPNRTISAGRVDIGAFRTFPEGYKPPSAAPSEYQSIPLNKIEDFGVHANSYYALQVEHFKSTLDTELLRLLWNKYWVSTLSQSPLIVNRSYAVGQVQDLAEKLSRAVQSTTSKGQTSQALANKENGAGKERERRPEKLMEEIKRREEDAPLAKAVRDGTKISAEAHHGLIAQALKDALFNGGGASAVAALPSFGDVPPPPAAQPAPATPAAQPVEPMQPAQPAESAQAVEQLQPAEHAPPAEASADTPTS